MITSSKSLAEGKGEWKRKTARKENEHTLKVKMGYFASLFFLDILVAEFLFFAKRLRSI